MDPLAHALFGGALAKSPVGRRSPLSAAALVVGSIAPDVDLITWWLGGRDAWIKAHAGLTHSPVGLVLLGLALVPFLRWVEREFTSRHSVFAVGGRPGTCATAVMVGLALHVPLDLLTDHGARPGYPLTGAWVRADLVHPTDPFLWLLFGGAAALAGKRSAFGSIALSLAVFCGWALIHSHGNAPGWLQWAFLGTSVLLGWMRAAEVGRKGSRVILARCAGLGCLYLVLLFASRADSVARVRKALAESAPDATLLGAHPTFGHPLRWSMLARKGREVLRFEVIWGRAPVLVATPQQPEHMLVQTALRLEESEIWRSGARVPVGTVTEDPDGSAEVALRDLAEADRPWDEVLRWRFRFPADQVQSIRQMFEEAERSRRR